MILNVIALRKQEARKPRRGNVIGADDDPQFSDAWREFTRGNDAIRRLVAIGVGTMAFSMEDVLLEPYGGQILHLTVGSTTKLTAALAIGGLIGFALASRVLSRGADPFRMASVGALVGIPAFMFVIFSAPLYSPLLFGLGTFFIGFGGGLFGHGTLTATMNRAPSEQRGMALGAWGAVQASAAGIAIAFGGVIRDLVGGMTAQNRLGPALAGPATGYLAVYALEIVLMVATLVAMAPLIRRDVPRGAGTIPAPSPLARDPLDTLVEFYANKSPR
jgi:BCD family chlorophyll transporter-like MFS transporter